MLKVRIKELILHHHQSEGVDDLPEGKNAVTFEVTHNAGMVWKMLRGLDELFLVADKTSPEAEIKELEIEKRVQASEIQVMEERKEAQEKTKYTMMRYLSKKIESVSFQNDRARSRITQLKIQEK